MIIVCSGHLQRYASHLILTFRTCKTSFNEYKRGSDEEDYAIISSVTNSPGCGWRCVRVNSLGWFKATRRWKSRVVLALVTQTAHHATISAFLYIHSRISQSMSFLFLKNIYQKIFLWWESEQIQAFSDAPVGLVCVKCVLRVCCVFQVAVKKRFGGGWNLKKTHYGDLFKLLGEEMQATWWRQIRSL